VNQSAVVNGSQLQNQSSSCWASSSQLSPQSHSQTVNSVHSSIQSVNCIELNEGGQNNAHYPPEEIVIVEQQPMTAAMDSQPSPEAKTTKKRGNEDETMMEERKSHDNSEEEEESGSIPDEIELNQNNQEYQNQRYLAEMAMLAQMYGDPNNFMKVMY